MMKKVSYLLILFVSMFFINSVKAGVTCSKINDMEYGFVFDDNGSLAEVIKPSGNVKPSAYTIEKSTDAGFVVKSEAECPIYENEYKMEQQKENGAVVRNHETYSFTNEYALRLNKFDVEDGDTLCPMVNDMDEGFVFDGEGKLKKIISSTVTKNALKPEIELSTAAGFIVKSVDKCPIYEREYNYTQSRHESGGIIRGQGTYSFTTDYYDRLEQIDASSDLGCSLYTTYDDCVTSKRFSCVWVERNSGKVLNNNNYTSDVAYCNVDNLQYVACGKGESAVFDIPTYLPRLVSFIINLLKIATPIILIFTSAISLLKAITASKEDEMEKAKKTLIRRIAIAALIFFTITITQFVIEKVADDDEIADFKDCLSCFINNDCNASKYYKNSIGGEYKCFYVTGGEFEDQSKCH